MRFRKAFLEMLLEDYALNYQTKGHMPLYASQRWDQVVLELYGTLLTVQEWRKLYHHGQS